MTEVAASGSAAPEVATRLPAGAAGSSEGSTGVGGCFHVHVHGCLPAAVCHPVVLAYVQWLTPERGTQESVRVPKTEATVLS